MDHETRFKIITEGQRTNVSEVCKKYGISRTIYYRWLTRYKENGISGLATSRKHPSPINKTSEELTHLVLQLIKTYPSNGPREIMFRVKDIGYSLSESAVYNIMCRHHLSTKQKRIRFANKRKAEQPNVHENPSLNQLDKCWVMWITFYGKFDSVGQVYEYTIYDFHTKIACSRLYQSLSLHCFEDLLTAVAIPVAQSLNLEVNHFCFMQDYDISHTRKQQIAVGIYQILSSNGLDGTMHLLRNTTDDPEAYQKRKEYTQGCLSHLLPYLNEGHSFDLIKLKMQQFVRLYNLHAKQIYDEGEFTPTEYHMFKHQVDMVLPLWAYIDRPYQEVKK